MIKILLVDDHVLLRAGLRATILELGCYEIAGEAKNGMEALTFLKNHSADVVLTDVQMPLMDGIELTKKITLFYPDSRVIAITMHSEEEYIRSMLHAGAAGYLLKSTSPFVLKEAVDTVWAGNNYYGKEIENAIKDAAERELDNISSHSLSQREIDVLLLIVQEKSNSEIADELFISIRTVDAHRRNLLRKTGSRNSVGLTKFAMKYQLL